MKALIALELEGATIKVAGQPAGTIKKPGNRPGILHSSAVSQFGQAVQQAAAATAQQGTTPAAGGMGRGGTLRGASIRGRGRGGLKRGG